MLASRNAEALGFLDDLRTIQQTEELVKQIEGYDFALALKTLKNMQESLG